MKKISIKKDTHSIGVSSFVHILHTYNFFSISSFRLFGSFSKKILHNTLHFPNDIDARIQQENSLELENILRVLISKKKLYTKKYNIITAIQSIDECRSISYRYSANGVICYRFFITHGKHISMPMEIFVENHTSISPDIKKYPPRKVLYNGILIPIENKMLSLWQEAIYYAHAKITGEKPKHSLSYTNIPVGVFPQYIYAKYLFFIKKFRKM